MSGTASDTSSRWGWLSFKRWFTRDADVRLAALAEKLRVSENARQTAEAANQAKSAFLANMSHEIRTPMTAILGFTEILEDPNLSADERANSLSTIRRNGEHLLNVINDVLDLSKIEAGKMTCERVAFSPIAMVEETASLMRVRASNKGLELRVRYESPVPETIQSDPTRVRQILLNLLGNAIKFTASGTVTIAVSCEGEQLKLAIRDTGIGLTGEQIEGLFQPFQQAEASTARHFGGSGLGLMISRQLARSLGGDIAVRSTIGQGSEFAMTVATGPIATLRRLDPDGLSRDKMEGAALPSLAGLRVLIADDGLDNQRLVRFILRKAGVTQIEAVGTGLAVVQMLQRGERFDVILMDMQMPEMDGYTAAAELRKRGVQTPIVALTAHNSTPDRDKCIAAGCTDYATKPIDREMLVNTIARCASGVRKAA